MSFYTNCQALNFLQLGQIQCNQAVFSLLSLLTLSGSCDISSDKCCVYRKMTDDELLSDKCYVYRKIIDNDR